MRPGASTVSFYVSWRMNPTGWAVEHVTIMLQRHHGWTVAAGDRVQASSKKLMARIA
jgi:hypothetical protein